MLWDVSWIVHEACIKETCGAPGETAQRIENFLKLVFKLIFNQERHKKKMERIPATLLLTVALCIVGCFCAPITTPPPPIPDPTPAPVNEGAKESDSSLADVEDVMMDPSAKLRKFSDTDCSHVF